MSPRTKRRPPEKPKKAAIARKPEAERVRDVPPPPSMPLSILRLHSFSAKIVPAKEIFVEPKQANTKLKVRSSASPETRTVSFAVTFRVEAIHPGEPSIGFVIMAEYQLQWEIRKPLPWPETSDELDSMGEGLVMRIIWPFWRELVLNATGRLGVPPLTLPLVFAGSMR
jgi:preprotein translocase subunit SecB